MQALRHQTGREPQTFDVLKKNDDGTVDLGHGKELVIGSSLVSEDGRPGTCTLIKSAKKPKADKPDAKAIADAKAALDAAEKAFTADPTREELGQAVDAARAALEDLQD